MFSIDLAYIPVSEVVLRLFIAVLFAFLIGLDREIKHKPFGFRPYMMVSLGAASFTVILMELCYSQQFSDEMVAIDFGRVMEGIIAGLGFLGAGAIIQAERKVVGATTGSGIWVVGGIGIASGLGLYWHALIVTLVVLFIMVILQPLHSKLKGIKLPPIQK